VDFSFRNYVKSALMGVPYSEMAIGSVSKKPGFYFSSPVKNSTGSIVGITVSKLDPAEVFADLETSILREYGHLMFVNGDGVIVSSTKPNFLYKSLFTLPAKVQEEIISEKRYPGEDVTPLDYEEAMSNVINGKTDPKVHEIMDEFDKEEEFVGIKKIGNYSYYLMTESSKNDILAAVSQISMRVGGVIFLALILVILAQLIFLKKVLSPLELLGEYAQKVSDGKLDEKVEIKTGDELETLAGSIQGMVASISFGYADLDAQMKEKAEELSSTLAKMGEKNADLEKTGKAVLNVMEDLAEEKEKIAAEKNRIETILRSIGDGVFVTDETGRVVMVNQAAEKMSGFSSIEMYGKKYQEVFKFINEDNTEADYPDFVGEAMKKGKVGTLLTHTVLRAKDGSTIPVLDSAAPLRTLEDGTVFGCVVVVRDNTAERELEKSKDDFLSVASHQLRTPLGSMRWNAEMLLEGDAGELNQEVKDIVGQIHEGNIRMIDLVNNLLSVSRIDQGRVMDSPEDVDLGEVIKAAVDEIQPLTKDKNVELTANVDQKLKKVKIDKNRFREVIENLISNAVKYNQPNGKVNVSLTGDDKNITISVSDTGMGIPKKDLGKLFSKFFRAENAVLSETEGTGLGLYVVKKFVEGWGGKLVVESELGKGSKFVLILPNDIKYKQQEKIS
jgi:PAS domain S-box-containing protein